MSRASVHEIPNSGNPFRRILFVAEAATLAHVVRPLLLARALKGTHELHFATSDSFKFVFRDDERIGEADTSAPKSFARHRIATYAPMEFSQMLARRGILFDEQRLSSYVREELSLIDDIQPDLVVGDLRPSLAVSAKLAGVPYWNLTNAYWSPAATLSSPPMPSIAALEDASLPQWLARFGVGVAYRLFRLAHSKILAVQGSGINAVRARHGLRPFSDYLSGFTSGDMTLFADTPTIVPLGEVPEQSVYLGPLSWSPNVELPEWWSELRRGVPLAYVSLGSSGSLKSIETVLPALHELGVDVVLTTAGRKLPERVVAQLSALEREGPRTFVADFLPGDEVARRVDFVVSNGGSPTSYQALAAGKPVLGIPSNMDQYLSMTHVERAGAGLLVRSDTISPAEIRRALRALTVERRFGATAAAVATEISSFDYRKIFPQLIGGATLSDAARPASVAV